MLSLVFRGEAKLVTIKRGLRVALAILFLWPLSENAVPILNPVSPIFSGVTGWTNNNGNFAIDLSGSSFAGQGVASYSMASSLFSLRSGSLALIVQIGTEDVPSAGIAPNEVLAVGYAIDAGALEGPYSAFTLFALTHTNPAVPSIGDYLAFIGPYWTSWGFYSNFYLWGSDWVPTDGFTFWDLVEAVRSEESVDHSGTHADPASAESCSAEQPDQPSCQ